MDQNEQAQMVNRILEIEDKQFHRYMKILGEGRITDPTALARLSVFSSIMLETVQRSFGKVIGEILAQPVE